MHKDHDCKPIEGLWYVGIPKPNQCLECGEVFSPMLDTPRLLLFRVRDLLIRYENKTILPEVGTAEVVDELTALLRGEDDDD